MVLTEAILKFSKAFFEDEGMQVPEPQCGREASSLSLRKITLINLKRVRQNRKLIILQCSKCLDINKFLRCKYGTMDESVILDLGTPLKSEKDYYKRKNTNALIEDGEIEFHQIAEDLIFHFFNEILGESPNYNSDLMNLEMTEYKKVNFDTI